VQKQAKIYLRTLLLPLHIKSTLKGKQFGDVEMIKFNVTQHFFERSPEQIRGALQAVENLLEKMNPSRRGLCRRGSVFHQGNFSIFGFTPSVQILFDQALYAAVINPKRFTECHYVCMLCYVM